jgi:hypothetical protein
MAQKTNGSPSRVLNFSAVIAIGVVMAALVAIVFQVIDRYPMGSDAGTVLGVIVPVFATVGAAVFGIPIAYQRGADTAEQKAAAAEQPKLAAAAKDGESSAKQKLAPAVHAVEEAIDRVLNQVRTQTTSRPGETRFAVRLESDIAERLPEELRPREPLLEIPHADVTDVEGRLGELRATLDGLGS